MSIVTAGSSDISLFFFIVEDVGGTNPGEPKTGLTHSDLDSAYFTRIRSTTTQITPLSTLAAANSSHSDGGFKEIDGTNRKGVYRFDPPDAPFVSGVNEVEVGLNIASAANAIARPLKVSILDFDLRESTIVSLAGLLNRSLPGNHNQGSSVGLALQVLFSLEELLETGSGSGSNNRFTAEALDHVIKLMARESTLDGVVNNVNGIRVVTEELAEMIETQSGSGTIPRFKRIALDLTDIAKEPTLQQVKTEVTLIKQVTDELADMLTTASGSGTLPRFTDDALINAPTGGGGGGGGDATAANQATILANQTVINNTINAIRGITDLLDAMIETHSGSGTTVRFNAAALELCSVVSMSASIITSIKNGLATAAVLEQVRGLAERVDQLIEDPSGSGSIPRLTSDALVNSPAGSASVTVADITVAALAKFLTVDTGESSAANGSVGKISQGAAGGNVTVSELTSDALLSIQNQLVGMKLVAFTPHLTGSLIEIVKGDDYRAGRAIPFPNSKGSWPDLTNATISLVATKEGQSFILSASGIVKVATGQNQKVEVSISSETTSQLALGDWIFALRADLDTISGSASGYDGDTITLQMGTMKVIKSVANA